jgi:LexA-binding, inner membrane-associated putative hydrolase
LDLPSHLSFGLAVALIFFGRPEIALLVGMGTLIPDLDREYWYVKAQIYADEQYHRARFHNVFLIAVVYILSPYLSLGVFLHALQDSFTTAKDRGVEWFYPLTRFVKRGKFDQNMNENPPDASSRIYFYQEDVLGYANAADPDLREGNRPVPWRRTYGFAQNGHLLDRGFLFGSLAIILIWAVYPFGFVHLRQFSDFISSSGAVWPVGYAWIVLLFAAGETQRRDKLPKLPQLKPMQVPLFVLGLALFVVWVFLFGSEIASNLESIFADPVPVIAGVVAVPLVSRAIVWFHTRGGKTAIV